MYGYTDIRERLEMAIPKWWQDILEARFFQETNAYELETIWSDFYTFQDGRYADLATTQLWKWEVLLGLKVSESGQITWDVNETHLVQDMENMSWDLLEFDYSTRRSAVLSRLRGFGAITRRSLEEMAKAYTGGAVNIIEFPGEYRVIIEFTDTIGVPAGIERLKEILKEAMPAHIQVEFAFKYIKWNQFDAKNWTFDILDAQLLTWDEFDALEPEGG
ncbi:putative phage tail protein [Planococcus faecalis]|uniref:DUF2313 domain-containing protein n=1 Tax=Planococcus faecalis TaxID=1598147 RepID=A0ABM6ISZ0_9BACL|nr:putative phage tail protein [Planococcus faecalis]AQU79709.1 hypothetical protein AJGP001_10735 [Planococcus faecalis]OHX55286.1 hypothetical protein BB777_04400 [Planococcus faecalis]